MAAAMRTNHAATEAYFANDDNRLLNLEPFARKPDAPRFELWTPQGRSDDEKKLRLLHKLGAQGLDGACRIVAAPARREPLRTVAAAPPRGNAAPEVHSGPPSIESSRRRHLGSRTKLRPSFVCTGHDKGDVNARVVSVCRRSGYRGCHVRG